MLFVNPEIKTNKDLPNVALAYAATIFNVKVIDLNTRPEPKDRFLEEKTDVLGISVQSRDYQEALRIRKLYQEKYPDTKVKSVHTPIDVQCCYSFLDLEQRVEAEGEFSDRLPFPDYELFDSFEIFKKNWKEGKWAFPVVTSLGCPFQCIYCQARNRKWRARSAENCFQELKQAKEKWGIKSFQVIDDCFSLDKERVLEFCNLVKSLGLKWFCTNGLRVDLFDKEIARAMAEAGCREMSFGIETIDPELLITIKKGETLIQVEEALGIAKKYFPRLTLYFIIGLPGSDYHKDLRSLRWACQNKARAHFSYFVPPQREFWGSAFYGRDAEPLSRAYDKLLQKRLYEMTGYMRGDPDKSVFLKNALKSFVLILFFDTRNIFVHLSNFFQILKSHFSKI